jgi:glyoxylase-like metal-dependent hydrolase (beta-lactamase superfamily II)
VITEGQIAHVGAYRIIPLNLGTLTIPAGVPMGGRVLAVRGYVVSHPRGTLLFDTGLGAEHPEFDARLSPTRNPIAAALELAGLSIGDITCVANCHLHYDHCGGNPLLRGVPTYVQRRDYEARAELNWYIEDRVQFPGSDLRLIDGEHEVLPGLRLVPTPGHTPGHQSLVIEDEAGCVILAGQAAYTAAEFADPKAEPARGWKTAWNGDAFLESIAYLKSLKPRRVYFAHDAEVWEP